MTKRRLMNEKQIKENKRRRPKIKLAEAPPINNIQDLIEISNSTKFYRNLDSIMLWRITPYLQELDRLVGMNSLKDSLFYQILYYLQGMHQKNKQEEYLHTMIYGLPGTGKTTVAKIIGKIYQGLGILSRKGNFKIAYRDDFIAGYLGQTAIKTQKLLKSCIGGVLFIDEVYALAPRDNDRDSFSKEALDTLTAFLSEHKNDFCCIAAGYEDDIETCFFGMNQGLRRRFPWVHRIEEYKPEHLTLILLKKIKEMNWDVSVSNKDIEEIIDKNKDLFKYAGGDIETYLTKCKMAHSKRVFALDPEHKFVLTKKDLKNGIKLCLKNSKKKKEERKPPPGLYI